MDEDIIESLKSFERVWERVESGAEEPVTQAAPAPRADGDVAMLRSFIIEEARDTAVYALLAKRSTGRQRTVFMRMAADEKRHLKALELEHFLMTGDIYPAPSDAELHTGVMSALREAYMREQAGCRTYLNAVPGTSSEALRVLYAELSDDECAHAVEIRQLIANAI